MHEVKTDKKWWEGLVSTSTSRRAGMGLLVASSIGFVTLTFLVVGSPSWITELDLSAQDAAFELRSSWMGEAMIWITRLGSRIVIGLLMLALTWWVMRTGRCRKALSIMVIAFLANPLLELLLKNLVGRPRPMASQLVVTNGLSFPSGHVLATVGFYGVLAAVIWSSADRRSIQIGAYTAATVIIVLVGFSRVYLGVHWFTDVVGATLLGIAFVLGVAWSLRGHHLGGDLGCEVQV